MTFLFNTSLKRAVQELKIDKPDMLSLEVAELELCLSGFNTNITVCDFALKYGTEVQLTILFKHIGECLADKEKKLANKNDSDLGIFSLFKDNITVGMDNVELAIANLKEACSSLIGSFKIKQPILNTDIPEISDKGANEVSEIVVSKDVGTQVDGRLEPDILCAVSKEKEQGACKYSGQSEAEISSESIFPTLYDSRVHYIAKHNISYNFQNGLSSHTSSCVLEDGVMIFLDKENNILKHISSTFEGITAFVFFQEFDVKDIVFLSGSLICIARGNVIETCCACMSCEKFHVVDELSMDSSPCSIMPLYDENNSGDDDDCDDISTTLAVLYSDKCVKIKNKSVDLVKTGRNYTQAFRLRSPFMIRARNKDELILAEENRVTVFERSGKMKWFFKMGDGEHVNFITYDTEGNIYICDTDSSKIHQISSATNQFSRKSRIIISDLQKPSTILFNHVYRTLVVGCKDDDCVYTYQFS